MESLIRGNLIPDSSFFSLKPNYLKNDSLVIHLPEPDEPVFLAMFHYLPTDQISRFHAFLQISVLLVSIFFLVSCNLAAPFTYSPAPRLAKTLIRTDSSFNLEVKDERSMVEIGIDYNTGIPIIPNEYSLSGPLRTGFSQVFQNLGFRWKQAPAQYKLVITVKQMLGMVQPSYPTTNCSGQVMLKVEIYENQSYAANFSKTYIAFADARDLGYGRKAVVKITNLALDNCFSIISRDQEFADFLEKFN